jgi:integrase
MLLTGLRRTDVLTARWANFDPARPSLKLPSPKGGEDRAFELPLSTAQLECLQRVKEAGQTYYPEESKTWIFPAPGGHVAEVKEEGRLKLSHTGHALRHSFRTLAAAAGIDRLRLKILMNHAIDDDVTDAYATASTAPTGPTPSAPPSPPAASGWSTPTSPISTGASRSAAR